MAGTTPTICLLRHYHFSSGFNHYLKLPAFSIFLVCSMISFINITPSIPKVSEKACKQWELKKQQFYIKVNETSVGKLYTQ